MNVKTCKDCGGKLGESSIMDYTYGGIGVQRYADTKIPIDKYFSWVSESNTECQAFFLVINFMY